ncbi:WHG domain-containing protein [Longispora sp. NPDC051575]|uniref:TetR/AcrR family transcriptional regulator n=1 Tax=Longispora sp. NPDC051575 TaxID=3154943 RepID=UPI0034471F84
MTAPQPSLRDRKRAATIDEIKAVAVRHLAADPSAMTLRGIAREVGMTVQSLCHYFPSREDLITALVTDAHAELATAVEAARPVDLVTAAAAYRGWALAHRSRFLLIYGTPVPGYAAPAQGPTSGAARRLGAAFTAAIYGGWSPGDLERVPPPGTDPALDAALARAGDLTGTGLPAGALGWGLALWAQLHGLVMLEILGHLPMLGDQAGAFYDRTARRAAADLTTLRP